MPAPPTDQFPGGGVAHHGVHHRHDFIPVPDVHEVELEVGVPYPQEMAVTLDEPGDGEHAPKIEDLGFRSDIRPDFPVASHCQDRIVLDGDGFSLGTGVINRHHLPIAQHQVGGDLGLDATSHSHDHRDRGERSLTKQRGCHDHTFERMEEQPKLIRHFRCLPPQPRGSEGLPRVDQEGRKDRRGLIVRTRISREISGNRAVLRDLRLSPW